MYGLTRNAFEALDLETCYRAAQRETHCAHCGASRPAGAPVAVTRHEELYAVCSAACDDAAVQAVDGPSEPVATSAGRWPR